MLTKGKFLVSFEVPGHTKDYTEEMVIPYRTEELNPYLRYPPPRNKQKSSVKRGYNPTTMNIIYPKVILSSYTMRIPTNPTKQNKVHNIPIIYTTLMIPIQRYL